MDFRMVALKAIEPRDIDGHTAEDIEHNVRRSMCPDVTQVRAPPVSGYRRSVG